jgi:hypothetical protein
LFAIAEIEFLPTTLRPKDIRLDFAELGLKQDAPYLLYEFWDQKFWGTARGNFTVPLLPHTCRLFCIRPAPPHPWVLSTDLHITQGGVELRGVTWDADSGRLSGVAQRPGGGGNLVIYVPKGFRLLGAELNDRPATVARTSAEIVKVPVEFQGGLVDWRVRFSR